MATRTTSPQQSGLLESNDSDVSKTSSKPLVPKLRKGAKAKYIIEEHPIMDGMGKVVRTAHTGLTYHCFFYVKAEKKWLRKSLHTKNLPEALTAGMQLMINTLATIHSGEKVFSKTYQVVVDEFLKTKQDEADVGSITAGRVTTIRSALNWAVKFAGGRDVKIVAVDGLKWKDYYVWRKQQKANVTDMTLANERSMISTFFKFANEKRYITRTQSPVWSRLSKAKVVERRDAFTDSEYDKVCRFLNHLDKHGNSEKDKVERQYIRDFFYISTNTGLRFGEMRRLTWNKITIIRDEKDSHGYPKCVIKLNKEDTKNSKAREVQGMRGDFFDRIKEYSKFTKPTDYVFSDNEKGGQLSKMVYYKLWKELMTKAELQDRKKLTWYSTRHTYATMRLLKSEGIDVFTLARNMGTSVKFIEEHYSHVKNEQMRDLLTSKKVSKPK